MLYAVFAVCIVHKPMKKVKIAIVGCGEIGRLHAKYLADGGLDNAECCAVCDISWDNLNEMKKILGGEIDFFDDYEKLLESHLMDGVLIATPHRFHCSMAGKAFKEEYHVLLEKPSGVYTKEVSLMNEAARESGMIFGIMFMERTRPIYKKMREMIRSGELGSLKRVIWIATEWYRTQSYYDLAPWRGTWEGEGGGVLINQSSHDLDLWQWICGMPESIMGYCETGKYHNIEVEDDATILAKYNNGAMGMFITTTGEAPGTRRIEIVGDRGKLVAENDKLSFWELDIPERKFNLENKEPFNIPKYKFHKIEVTRDAPLHRGITENWADAILGRSSLIAKGEEGINSLMISNGAYLSSWGNCWVDLPVDSDKFFEMLSQKIYNSINERT